MVIFVFDYFLSRNNEFQFCITEMSTNSPVMFIWTIKSVCQCFVIESDKGRTNCLFYLARYFEWVEDFLKINFVKSIFIILFISEFNQKSDIVDCPKEGQTVGDVRSPLNSIVRTELKRKARTSQSYQKPYVKFFLYFSF